MEIKVSTENGRVPVTIMGVTGNIDSSNHMALQKKAEGLIKDGARYLLLDLSGVPYMSSAGLRALNAITDQLRSLHPDMNLSEEDMLKGINAGTYKSPHLKLLNMSEQTRTAFEMAGFDMYLETYTDLKTAVASF